MARLPPFKCQNQEQDFGGWLCCFLLPYVCVLKVSGKVEITAHQVDPISYYTYMHFANLLSRAENIISRINVIHFLYY